MERLRGAVRIGEGYLPARARLEGQEIPGDVVKCGMMGDEETTRLW